MAVNNSSTMIEQSTEASAATASTTKPQRRVHFGQVDDVHMIPAEEMDPDASWYGADEMRMSFRADVIDFLKEFKRNQTREASFFDDEDDESIEPVCSRGLEMYFPGEIALRKRIRALFSENVLRKYKDLCDIFEDPNEVADYLQQFASALCQTSQKKAHALGLQDAVEARIVYAEGLEETTASTLKDPPALDFVPLLKHESKTELSNCKARAA